MNHWNRIFPGVCSQSHHWHNNGKTWLEQKPWWACGTACRDKLFWFAVTRRYDRTSPGILCTHIVQIDYILSRRPVWPDNFRQFVHNLVKIFFRPCRNGRTLSHKHTQFVYIHSGLVWTQFRPRHVAKTTSCRTYVVPQLVLPFRMARIKSVVLCRDVHHKCAVLYSFSFICYHNFQLQKKCNYIYEN